MQKIYSLLLLSFGLFINTSKAQLREATSINSNEISIIEVAPSGFLWIGLKGSGCIKFDPTNGSSSTFNKTNTTMPTDSVRSIDSKIISGVLNVMMGTNKGVSIQKGGVWSNVQNLPDSKVTDIAVMPDHRIIFSTEDSGFAVYDTLFNLIKTIKMENVVGMTTNNIKKMSRKNLNCGTIYAATNKGVLIIDSANNVTKITVASSSIASDSITCIYATKICNNEVVIGSDKGISICSGLSCFNYNTSNGLSSNFITVIERDSAGRIWIGTKDSGLIYFDNINFTKITKADGLPSNAITDINCVSKTCTCYVGTKDNGVVSVGCDKKVSSKFNISSVFDLKNGNAVLTYPQPANDKIYFKLIEQVNQMQFTLYDFAGNKVKSQILNQVQEFNIEVEDLPQGFYTYTINDYKGMYVSGKSLIVR